EFPTVSMGLSPLMAIYQARFNRYLEDRGMKPATDAKVWAFLGDGETDEPESLGAITLASREKLDNLIFVINCNLQRLDGPVRGVQGSRGAQRLSDGNPRAHHQGLRAGRSGRGEERYAPAEETQRRRIAGIPLAVRHSPERRGLHRGSILSATRRQR